MTRYRDPSFDFMTIRSISCAESVAVPLLRLALEADYVNDEQYEKWVIDWKANYNHLSSIIASLKQNRRNANPGDGAYSVALDSLRRLANTLLNARQYAKDRRKAVLEADKLDEFNALDDPNGQM